MDTTSPLGWDAFLSWASLFYAMPNFDEEERAYKLRAVEPLRRARQALLDGDNWLPCLSQGFKNKDNNLVTHWQFIPFLDWVTAEPQPARDAMVALWEGSERDGPERLERFDALLPHHVLSGPGLRCNLGAYLLGAMEPVAWPNYKVTATQRAFELTRTAPCPREASMGVRYQHALTFFDRLLVEAGNVGLLLADRLDAQGVMWCVVQWSDRPETFTPDQWDALLVFRSTPSSPRRKTSSSRQSAAPSRPRRPTCPLCGHDDGVRLIGRTQDSWEWECEETTGHDDPWLFRAS